MAVERNELKYFDAMIVSLLAVVRAVGVAVVAVVARRVTHETVLQRFIALLVPLEMADHLLLLDEHSILTVQAVKVLPISIKVNFTSWNHVTEQYL